MEKFDKIKYKVKFDKENYTRLTIALKKKDAETFKSKLKDNNISISDFFRKCTKNIEEILKIFK